MVNTNAETLVLGKYGFILRGKSVDKVVCRYVFASSQINHGLLVRGNMGLESEGKNMLSNYPPAVCTYMPKSNSYSRCHHLPFRPTCGVQKQTLIKQYKQHKLCEKKQGPFGAQTHR